MKRIDGWYRGLKLNRKFTIIVVLMVWMPVAFFAVVFFHNIQNNLMRDESSSMAYELKEDYGQIVNYVDSINMATQFFLSDQALQQFLESVKRQEPMETEQLRKFYKEDIASLERLVNSNLYLYQIRVYADSDTMQEMMPILYRQSRMERLEWAAAGEETDWEGWHFDYRDTLFDSSAMDQGRKIMSCVTRIQEYGIGDIGLLEVAMRMETMFPHLYEEMDGQWSCFIDGDGNAYLGNADTQKNRELLELILLEAQKGREEEEKERDEVRAEVPGAWVRRMELDHTSLVVGYLPVKELSGVWIRVNDMSRSLGTVRRQRNLFAAAMIGIMVLLAFVVNLVVRGVLRQFYSILFSIRQVQKGDLNVVIKTRGYDEMAELGTQINKMLERIRQLMDDNLKRELLIKNSEIKALQNQINAHFIYNVLESIKMMAEIDEEYEISDAITRLGRLLRYSMKWVSGNVTVEEELEYIRNYLALMNLRYDYEIYLSENIPELVLQQEIPKMSLQPVVENAICHGIEEMAEDTNIYIKGLIEGEDCVIEITDAGKGMSPEQLDRIRRKIAGEVEASGGSGNGIGLKNVQDRIHMSFGEGYGIEVASMEGCYTKVRVRIPITRRTADWENAAGVSQERG